jgi:hypothetical protein
MTTIMVMGLLLGAVAISAGCLMASIWGAVSTRRFHARSTLLKRSPGRR